MSKPGVAVLVCTLLAMVAASVFVPAHLGDGWMRSNGRDGWVGGSSIVADTWQWIPVWDAGLYESTDEEHHNWSLSILGGVHSIRGARMEVHWGLLVLQQALILLLGGGLLTFVVRRERRRKVAG